MDAPKRAFELRVTVGAQTEFFTWTAPELAALLRRAADALDKLERDVRFQEERAAGYEGWMVTREEQRDRLAEAIRETIKVCRLEGMDYRADELEKALREAGIDNVDVP